MSTHTFRALVSTKTLVVFGPWVLLEEAVDHLFHRKVWNELILSQMRSRHRVEMADSLVNMH